MTNKIEPKHREWMVKNKSGTPWEVVFPRRAGLPPKRRFFPTREAAEAEIVTWNRGSDYVALGKRKIDAMQAAEALLPEGTTILDAVRFYLQHYSGVSSVTLKDVCTGYLNSIKKKAPDYRYEQERAVNDVLREFGADALFSSLGKAKLVGYIKAPDTYWVMYARKRIVSCLVSKARELEAIKENPLDGVKWDEAPKATKHFLTLPEVEVILHYAQLNAPELVNSFALQLFAGVRTEELCRDREGIRRPLQWSDIEMGKLITVPIEVSKVSEQRDIRFWPEALTNWLTPGKGDVCPVSELDDAKSKMIRRLNKEREAEGKVAVRFKQNAFRHTYATYAVAYHQDAAVAQLAMGHADQTLLKKTYASTKVSQADAVTYFRSKP